MDKEGVVCVCVFVCASMCVCTPMGTKKQTLNSREHSDGQQRGGGWGGWAKLVMGMKECHCWDEH